MTSFSTLSPNGWLNDWVSAAQVYPGYNGNPDNNLNKTVVALSQSRTTNHNQEFQAGSDPQNTLMIDGYMTYYGTGYSADNRSKLLTKADLATGGKTPWPISIDMGQQFNPLLVVYTNDNSTSESTFNMLTDLASTGGSETGKTMPVNVLTNMALQIGALLGARIASANPSARIDASKSDLSPAQISTLRQLKNSNFIKGDILLTPDGFGSYIQNYDRLGNKTVNTGTTFVFSADTNVNLVDDHYGGYYVQQGSTTIRRIPGKVTINNIDYTVQSKLAPVKSDQGAIIGYTLVLGDPQGKLYGEKDKFNDLNSLDLPATAEVNARQTVQESLRYLQTLRPQYEAYGVVFPEIFYASQSEFEAFVDNLLGFSDAGIQRPALTAGDSVADTLATQTYLAKLFAGRLNIAYVLNPWAIGNVDGSRFINKPWYLDGKFVQDGSNLLNNLTTKDQVQQQLQEVARQVKDKATDLGWFKASPYMDYLALDKYERDEISGIATVKQSNAYNRNAWFNYAYYGKQLSEQLRTGPASATASGEASGSGNADLLYFQIPAASLPAELAQGATGPFINGSASPQQASEMQTAVENVNMTNPHYSFAFDSFFGNPDLNSKAAFQSKYPDLASLTIKKGNQANVAIDINLADYLFSTAPNALEDSGSHDLTKGLLSIVNGEAIVNREIMGDVFGIVWGGGNTSTPLSYSNNQWLEGTIFNPGPSISTAYVPNSEQIVPLVNTTNRLADWAAASYPGSANSPDGEVAVRSLGLTFAAVKTDGSGKLSLAIASQASNTNSIYLYKLNASNDMDAITGLTIDGNDPFASSTEGFFNEIKTNNLLVANGLNIQTAGQANGSHVRDLTVNPNSYYGLLLVSQVKDGLTYSTTSYAASGSWRSDATKPTERGIASVALVDSSQISNIFFGGIAKFADNRVLGFEDNILSGRPDFDYNDVFIGITSGGMLMITPDLT